MIRQAFCYKWFFLPILLIFSCRQVDLESVGSLQGHYQESSAEAMAPFAQQQRVVPEYLPVESIIVGHDLIARYQRFDLLDEILKSGVDRIWIVANKNLPRKTRAEIKHQLQSRFESRLHRFGFIEQVEEGIQSPWARDWAPLSAQVLSDRAEKTLRLIDFNYSSLRPGSDAAGRTFERLLQTDRISIPLYFEGGNFMVNRASDCFMSNRIIAANQYIQQDNDQKYNESQIIEFFKDFVGCRSVFFFDQMPYEPTGHIDMWAKFLDDETVVVSALSHETIDRSDEDDLYQVVQMLRIKDFLDRQAQRFQDLGLTVLRLPLPLPVEGKQGFLIRSYTNSLIVNGRVLVPQYLYGLIGDYPDEDLAEKYEDDVRSVYEALGYEVVFIPSDQLILDQGAIHCATMQIPRIEGFSSALIGQEFLPDSMEW